MEKTLYRIQDIFINLADEGIEKFNSLECEYF